LGKFYKKINNQQVKRITNNINDKIIFYVIIKKPGVIKLLLIKLGGDFYG